MPTTAAFEVLQICFKFTQGLLPLTIYKSRNKFHVVHKITSPKIKYFWFAILSISFLITSLELYFVLSNPYSKNIVVLFYHIFLFLTKLAVNINVFLFNSKAPEVSQFLNCLYRNPSIRIRNSTKTTNSTRDINNRNAFTIVLIICTITVTLFDVVCAPLGVLALPCLHQNKIGNIIYGKNCSTLGFRIRAFVTQFVFMVPVSSVISVVTSVCLVTLFEIRTILQNFW